MTVVAATHHVLPHEWVTLSTCLDLAHFIYEAAWFPGKTNSSKSAAQKADRNMEYGVGSAFGDLFDMN